MASKSDMKSPLDLYRFKRPYNVSDMSAALFNRTALTDTEDKQEARQKEKKGRDDE